MKFNKFLILLKVVLIALLIANSESRSLSKKSLSTAQRFQNNYKKFQSKFVDVKLKDVADLFYGIVAGYVHQQAINFKTTLDITLITAAISIDTLRGVFSECVDESNEKFAADAKAAKKTANFNMFVSVLPQALSDIRINKYINNCQKKDHVKKDIEYTKDHLLFLTNTLQILENHQKKKQEKRNTEQTKTEKKNKDDEEEKLINELKVAKDYFNYQDTTYLSYFTTKTRTICSYLNKEENWKAIIGRWFDYGTNMVKCGAKKFVSTFFSKLKNPEILIPLLEVGLNHGFSTFLGLGVFKLARAVYRFMRSLIYGGSNYYAVGETLGRELAELSPFVPKVTVKRRRYRY